MREPVALVADGVDLDIWIDRSLIRYGYAWSVPADEEQRVGVGSYEPRDHVRGRSGETVRTDRGTLTAPLIVDALGWRRVLGPGANVQPPDARISRVGSLTWSRGS